MAKAQRTDQQAGNDLVANAQHRDALEHAVAQPHRRRHCDHIAAEQRQLHGILPLRHAIAHRGCRARYLRCRADLAGEDFHLFGISAIRLMRREHVIVSAHNADVHCLAAANGCLVLAACGKTVREISTAERCTV